VKAKRFGIVALGILGVCFPTMYASIMVYAMRTIGGNRWAVAGNVMVCALIASLGAVAIYQGLRKNRSSD
jgi:hypothetical protein